MGFRITGGGWEGALSIFPISPGDCEVATTGSIGGGGGGEGAGTLTLPGGDELLSFGFCRTGGGGGGITMSSSVGLVPWEMLLILGFSITGGGGGGMSSSGSTVSGILGVFFRGGGAGISLTFSAAIGGGGRATGMFPWLGLCIARGGGGGV